MVGRARYCWRRAYDLGGYRDGIHRVLKAGHGNQYVGEFLPAGLDAGTWNIDVAQRWG
ncbi:MAG: hypothetical protein K0Q83_2483 [Deltaproteobacteria bacterium]|nr:hypothetical protein [Deltaproteobacteria bacterium]